MNGNYSKAQGYFLVVLRLLVGWHFLYEGLVKFFHSSWTSKGYLLTSEGPFSFFFEFLATDWVVSAIDYFIIVALLIVGLTLILGYMVKSGAYLGMVVLLLFYLAHPPLPGLDVGTSDGNYLFVDRNLIEMITLGVIAYFPTSHIVGLDRLSLKKRNHE